MEVLAPILLFVYNRPEHTRRLVESLSKNNLASRSPLVIYSDAPKTDADRPLVDEVRSFIHSIKGFATLSVIEREKNHGLAKNIINGVSTQIERFGRVIVLEDDLIVAPYFLQFMNDALEVYKDESRVGHIQACDFTGSTSLPDTFLIKWTGSWGWATWKRAWKLFNPNGTELLEQLESRNLTKEFDFNGNYPFTRMLRRQIAGINHSWAIRWNASLFLSDMLSLNVGKSLVRNTGFDGSGTNCGGGNLYDSTMCLTSLPVTKISPITENIVARKIYEHYYHRINNFMAKAIRRIRRTLKGDFGA
jgi:hypothetical protein